MIAVLALSLVVTSGSFAKCPAAGDAKKATAAALDVLKNRATDPVIVDPAITLEAMLAPRGDATRWQNSQAATITGYVIAVTEGSIETSNCHAKDALHRDTHLQIALTRRATATQAIVVEVTPRWRTAAKAAGLDWSTAALKTLIGKRVRVTGWLLLDAEHLNASAHTHKGAHNWRASAWEVHPVTALEELP